MLEIIIRITKFQSDNKNKDTCRVRCKNRHRRI